MAIRQNFNCPPPSTVECQAFCKGSGSGSAEVFSREEKEGLLDRPRLWRKRKWRLSNLLVTNNVTLLSPCPHDFSHSLLTITACSCRWQTLSLC